MPELDTLPQVNLAQDSWLNKAEFNWLDDSGRLIPPKEHAKNLMFRLWLKELEKPGVDPDHKIKASVLNRCRNDIIFFFNAFLWTKDPRKRPADLPFITYDYEDEYILWLLDHIKKGKDCLTEKSRDMGISWCALGVILHCWMFQPGFLSLLGSKKEDDVDRSGDIRSLFEKLRYYLQELPDWLKPFGFDWKKHSMFMRLLNPMNNNSITGESSNKDFGRSGRFSCCLLDEFASMEYADDAWTATGDASPCRIPISTPKGSGNKFWELRFKSNIDIYTAHWTRHPEKASDVIDAKTKQKIDRNTAFQKWKNGEEISSSWYENEKNRRLTNEKQSKIDIAQELDIDYIASGDPFFDIGALKKQVVFEETTDWLNFERSSKKVIIGTLTEIDGRLEFRPNKNGWLRLFETPKANGQYVGAADAAEGLKHGDFSAAAFRNKATRNLVAAIYGHYDYDELSYYCYLTAKFFNNCMICAEAGGYGSAVNKRLFDLGANVARAVSFDTGSMDEKDKLGWINSSKTRPHALGDMEAEIREQATELRDKDLMTECYNFVNKDGKPQASDGSTDDFVWAYAIAGQLLRYFPYSRDMLKKGRIARLFSSPPPNNMGFGFKK